MKVLVLGGTHHVGRSIVEVALARGDDVTMLNRGVTGPPHPRARPCFGPTAPSRTRCRPPSATASGTPCSTRGPGRPSVVRSSARMLAGRTRHYGYVSSRSVYVWPIRPGLDESAPVVDGDPSDDDALDYAAAKRGSELAVLETFSATLVARAGLILGPYEDVGRLPWWLRRIEAGRPRARARTARPPPAVHRRPRPRRPGCSRAPSAG